MTIDFEQSEMFLPVTVVECLRFMCVTQSRRYLYLLKMKRIEDFNRKIITCNCIINIGNSSRYVLQYVFEILRNFEWDRNRMYIEVERFHYLKEMNAWLDCFLIVEYKFHRDNQRFDRNHFLWRNDWWKTKILVYPTSIIEFGWFHWIKFLVTCRINLWMKKKKNRQKCTLCTFLFFSFPNSIAYIIDSAIHHPSFSSIWDIPNESFRFIRSIDSFVCEWSVVMNWVLIQVD